MKTAEEIKQLAFGKYPRVINDPYNPMEDDNSYERQIWIDGYTECQEEINKMPIHIMNGISNTKVSIVNGIVIVEPFKNHQ